MNVIIYRSSDRHGDIFNSVHHSYNTLCLFLALINVMELERIYIINYN